MLKNEFVAYVLEILKRETWANWKAACKKKLGKIEANKKASVLLQHLNKIALSPLFYSLWPEPFNICAYK